MTLIKDLIHIPEQVSRGDFVLNLAHGVQHPEETVNNYVVTEQLAEAFDEAMKFIKPVYSGSEGKSKASYLHGSFGCGKSHFMAVLSLILDGHSSVKNKPVLQPIIEQHTWIDGKKFLLVPIHMIGVDSMEQGVLGGYAKHINKLHPDANVPAFYPSNEIIKNSIELKRSMGDEAFFNKLNSSTTEGNGGWGDLEGSWNDSTFDAAISSKDPMEENHRKLVSDIIEHLIPSLKSQNDFLPLDEGLVALSHHAKDLGYEGIILFLDELVLWLMSRSVDSTFIGKEGPKMSKLVEGKISDAPIPIVSFIARQRDLREVLGDGQTIGAGVEALSSTMDWWDERFHTIKLEDRNLPIIVEERLLKPKDGEAKEEISQAFEQTSKVRKEVRDVLTTNDSTVDDFQRLYPFSPALIQVLIAVSAVLQRERTALRILLQILCDQRDSLKLGQVVPVGDLWDEITRGEEVFAPQMKELMDQARRIYSEKFQLLLLADCDFESIADLNHASEEKLQQYRTQDRIVKTLLLAALVPGVESLRNLTANRLAALNHGTIKSPIRNREGSTVLTWVRKWAAQIGELRQQGDPSNPFISIELSGIDTDSIIRQAQAEDNIGNRKKLILELLSESLQFPLTESGNDFTRNIMWKGTQREVEIRYFNLREANSEQLKSTEERWTVVFDFPFDDSGFTPAEDVNQLHKLKDKLGEGTNTLIWLPNFLSDQALADLGKLVIINYLLQGTRLEAYTDHLNSRDRIETRNLLESQRSALHQRMLNYLEMCYGLTQPQAGAVNEYFSNFSDHFRSLAPQFRPQPPQSTELNAALENLVHQALEHQYPLHPTFGMEVKPSSLKRISSYVSKALNDPHSRCDSVERAHMDIMKKIAEPLELGTSNESIFTLKDTWVNRFRKELASNSEPSVQEVYDWIDKPEARGLSDLLKNLIVWQFANQEHCAFYKYGSKVDMEFNNLSSVLSIKPEPLPKVADWENAIEKCEHLFGYTPPLMNFRNVSTVSDMLKDLRTWERENLTSTQDLVGALKKICSKVDLKEDNSNRYQVAIESMEILSTLNRTDDDKLIEKLASLEIKSDLKLIAISINNAQEIAQAVESINWTNLNLTQAEGEIGIQATSLKNEVRKAMEQHESSLRIEPILKSLNSGLNELLIEANKRIPTKANNEDIKRQQEDQRRREEEIRIKEEEIRRKEEEFAKRQKEIEEQERIREAERLKRLEEERKQEEERLKKAEQLAKMGMSRTVKADNLENELAPKLKEIAKNAAGKRVKVTIEVLEN